MARSRLSVPAALLTVLAPLAVALETLPADAASCARVTKVTLPAGPVIATTTISASIRLACASSSSVRVTLTGSGLGSPASVLVPARKASATVKVLALPTAVNRTAKLTARAGGVSRADTVAVRTSCASRIASFAGKSLYAGDKSTTTLRLACAPRSAVAVALRSSDARVKVPASVRVLAGKTSVAVPITVTTGAGDRRTTAVTATYGGRTAKSSILVTPGLSNVQLTNQNNNLSLVVGLTGAAPAGGLTFALTSSSSKVTVPATYTFPQYATGGDVPDVTASPVTVDTPVTISVKLGTRTLQASTVLKAPFNGDFSQATLGVSEDDTIYGGRPSISVFLSLPGTAPAGGIDFTWSVQDDNPALSLESTSGFIPAGQRSTGVDVTIADVTQTTTVVVRATRSGQTVSVPVTIQPRLVSVTLPASVVGGQTATGTLTLAGAASSDQVFTVNASRGGITVPLQVVVPAGLTQVTFSVGTIDFEQTEFVTVFVRRGAEEVESSVMAVT